MPMIGADELWNVVSCVDTPAWTFKLSGTRTVVSIRFLCLCNCAISLLNHVSMEWYSASLELCPLPSFQVRCSTVVAVVAFGQANIYSIQESATIPIVQSGSLLIPVNDKLVMETQWLSLFDRSFLYPTPWIGLNISSSSNEWGMLLIGNGGISSFINISSSL